MSKRFDTVFMILTLAFWAIPLYMFIHDMLLFRYPTVISPVINIPITALFLLAPLAAWVASLIGMWKEKKRLFTVGLVLYVVLLGVMFLHGLVRDLYAPFVCSYTTDAKNCGEYDSSVKGTLGAQPKYIFPDQVPESATEVHYEYCYLNLSSEDYWVCVSFRPEDGFSFSRAREELITSGYECLENDRVYRLLGDMTSMLSEVVLDEESGTVAYYLTREWNEELLPATAEQAKETVSSEHWFYDHMNQ